MPARAIVLSLTTDHHGGREVGMFGWRHQEPRNCGQKQPDFKCWSRTLVLALCIYLKRTIKGSLKKTRTSSEHLRLFKKMRLNGMNIESNL